MLVCINRNVYMKNIRQSSAQLLHNTENIFMATAMRMRTKMAMKLRCKTALVATTQIPSGLDQHSVSLFYTNCAIHLSTFTFAHFFFDCSMEKDKFQEASGDEDKTDEDRPIENGGKPAKPSWLSC